MKNTLQHLGFLSFLCFSFPLALTTATTAQLPPPNLPSGMYQNQGHIYYWNKSRQTTCHVVNPVQYDLFTKKGFPNQTGVFTPYNYQNACLWPQGVYEPPGEGKALYISSRKEICHIPTPELHSMLADKYGVNNSSSFAVISNGLKNIGICKDPG
jgi:hypothetical protein